MSIPDPLFANPKLVADLVSGQGYHLRQLCVELQLRPSEFAQLVGRETESVARSVKRDDFVQLEHAGTLQVVRELVELLGLSRALGVDAGAWLKTPLPSYEGRTPFELVSAGKGRELIARMLGLVAGDVGG